MLAAIASAWALLLGIALIMLGNGLQGTLLGVRATLEGFGTGTTGLVLTGYFAGFMAGSWIVPRLLAKVGHVRVFAALASSASGGRPAAYALRLAAVLGPDPAGDRVQHRRALRRGGELAQRRGDEQDPGPVAVGVT